MAKYGTGLHKITDEAIGIAVAIDDLDMALVGLQTIAEIDDGGVASHVFSDMDNAQWAAASADEREAKLREWLQVEARYAFDDSDKPTVGSRVKLVKAVENYPVILAKAGLTGTLVRIDSDGSYWVRLDQQFDTLKEWNNELQIWDWSAEHGADFSAVSHLALINEVVS